MIKDKEISYCSFKVCYKIKLFIIKYSCFFIYSAIVVLQFIYFVEYLYSIIMTMQIRLFFYDNKNLIIW